MKNSIKITAIFAAILAILFIVPNASKATTREVTDESTLISEILRIQETQYLFKTTLLLHNQ